MDSFFQELEELYNQAPCGYHSLDSEGKIVRINDTELQMLGYSREEVLGRKFSELLTSESLSTFQQNFPIFKQRGWVNDLEFQFIHKDGTLFPVSLSATAIKDEAGNFVMSRSIVIDISKRKQLEAERRQTEANLRATEERYRLMFESNPNPMWFFDPDTLAFLEVNQAAIAHYGYSQAEFSQMTIADFIPAEDLPALHQTKTELIPGHPHVGVWRHRKKDGSIIDAEVTAFAFSLPDRQSNLALIRDITLIKAAEEISQRAAKLDAFHVSLSNALRPLTDANEIQAIAARVLGEYLGASRVIYLEVISGNEEVIVHKNYTNGVAQLSRRYRLEDYRRNLSDNHQAGLTQIVTDIANDPKYTDAERARYSEIDIAAHIDVPLIKNAQFVALLAVHQATPRQWTETEVKLVEETAEQTWAGVERARAEAALRENRIELERQLRKFDEIVAAIPDFIYTFDLSGRFTYINQPLLDLWQKTADEALGKNFFELDYPIDLANRLQQQIQQVIETRQPLKDETPYTSAISTRFYEYIFVPLFNADGAVEAVAGVTRDINERKQAELARERFLAVASDLQIIAGSNGYFHWVSPTFEQVLGRTTKEMTSRPWIEFVHPDDISPSIAESSSLFAGKETLYFENRYRHQDGSYRWLLWKAQPYQEEELIYGAGIDITERKQAELALQQQIAREHLLAKITQAIHQTLDVEQILQSAVIW